MKNAINTLLEWVRKFLHLDAKSTPNQPPSRLPSGSKLPDGQLINANDSQSQENRTGNKAPNKSKVTELTGDQPNLVMGGSDKNGGGPTLTTPQNGHLVEDHLDNEGRNAGEIDGATSNSNNRTKPGKHGPRRDREKPKKASTPKQPRQSQPELCCREINTGKWEVFLSWDEECHILSVSYDGKELNIGDLECNIPSLKGNLNISYKDGQQSSTPLFKDNKPLIFKLKNGWTGIGRNTLSIRKGHYIIIAPNTWERTGHVPIEMDQCTDSDFNAHYFDQEKNAPYEETGSFKEWSMDSNTIIELAGQTVYDNSDEGELFIGNVPTLNASEDIMWARVGEESKGGWSGESFKPSEKSLSDILDGREGRFFLRIYNSQSNLLDSIEFRYLRNLKEIQINESPYRQETILLPTKNGYSSTQIRFMDTEGKVMPTNISKETSCSVDAGIITVSSNSHEDHIECTLETKSGSVKVVVDIPRIWWQVKSDGEEPKEWTDKPQNMTRQEFKKFADENSSLCILSRLGPSISASFDEKADRTYKRKKDEEYIKIPLTDFAYHAQITQRSGEISYLQVKWAENTLPVVKVAADPTPEIVSFSVEPKRISYGEEAILQWTIRNMDDAQATINPDIGTVNMDGVHKVTPIKTTNYTLTLTASNMEDIVKGVNLHVDLPSLTMQPTASIKSANGRWRQGKGFSIGEIEGAGLNLREAIGWLVSVDKRRRSSHSRNIEKLKGIHDGSNH